MKAGSVLAYALLFTGSCAWAQTVPIDQHTDESGLITVGIFERTSTTLAGKNAAFEIPVPADFEVVGGGVQGGEYPGNYVTRTMPSQTSRNWLVGTTDHQVVHTIYVKGWAIGLKIEGVNLGSNAGNLSVLRQRVATEHSARASSTAGLPPGFILIGGGMSTGTVSSFNTRENLATASYPVIGEKLFGLASPAYFGWRGRSKDHGIAGTNSMTAYTVGLNPKPAGMAPGTITPTIVKTTRPLSLQGGAATAYLPAGYALTGCGAHVEGEIVKVNGLYDAGQLIWKIRPVVAGGLRGCEVAAKPHIYEGAAAITAFAVGVKFVPGP